jgi:hypothetical protein
MLSRRRFTCLLTVLAALAGAGSAAAQADAPITEADLRRHVDILASDRFEGRKPGTAGEQLTTDYIVRELTARGVQPGQGRGSGSSPCAWSNAAVPATSCGSLEMEKPWPWLPMPSCSPAANRARRSATLP